MHAVAALLAGGLVALAASDGHAQIVSGRINQPGTRDANGNWNAPPMPLDTDVGTRGPTFRSSVTRVELSALVVDGSGRPVSDLKADDFEVFDGGRKQKVQSFSAYSRSAAAIPLDSMPPAEAAATAPTTNAWAGTSRMVALVIDDLHIDARYAERARTAARQLVTTLAPSDLLFVGLTSSPSESTAAFTRDRARALRIIDRFGGMRLVDPTQEMRRNPNAGASAPGLSASDAQRSMRLVDAYETIQRVATAARVAPGRRKSLIFLSQGSPVGASATASGALTAEATGAMLNAVAAASVADVAVYPLNPAGLDTPTDRMAEGFTRQLDEEGRDIAHVDLSNMIAEFLQAKNQLRDLAALTGGVSLIDRNNLDAAIARVLSDASDYYAISYEPDKAVKGTKVRPIEVRVKRPGLRVYSRRGYLAPPAASVTAAAPDAKVSPQIAALLTGIIPEDGVPMVVHVIPVSHVDGSVRYAVVVDAAGAVLTQGLDKGELTLEQAVADVDGSGRLGKVASRKATLKLTPAQVETFRGDWVRTIWAVDLSPGEHQVRVATLRVGTGQQGSMYVDVTAESGQELALEKLSDVLAIGRPIAFADPVLQDLLSPARR